MKIRNILFITSLLLALPIVSQSNVQNYDADFINSLPEATTSKLFDQIETNKSNEEVTYKRPSSNVSAGGGVFSRFGMDIFNSMQSTFMPINEPNFDSEYVLGFGDILQVQLIGQKAYIEDIEVKRDGSISLKGLGKSFVGGLTLNNAINLIKAKAASAYIGNEIFVSLISVRDIQVYILGEAKYPGLYTLNGNSNVLHALSVAGGVNGNGSFRNIEIKRNNVAVDAVDVYDLFLKGNADIATRLKSGDVVFVKPVKKLVSIHGGVKVPREYELLDTDTLQDLINFAKGFSTYAAVNKPIYISSIDKGEKKSVYYSGELSELIPSNNDSIFIETYTHKNIIIQGAVKFPGSYKIGINDRLSDAIISAGGYREDAYPFGGILENEYAGEVSKMGSDFTFNELIKDIILNDPSTSIGMLSSLKPPGTKRVVANFILDEICDDEITDTMLQDGDKLFVPTITQQVYVYGAINSPGASRFIQSRNVFEYIADSGGFTKDADKDTIFVIQPNGESILIRASKLRLFGRNAKNVKLYPGSLIFITPELKISPQKSASIWAPLVSSFALTLASVSSLNNN